MGDAMRRLGMPPMPWQSLTLDVVYEVDIEATEQARSIASAQGVHQIDLAEIWRLWYREDRTTVPRQSGKTTRTLARHVYRHLYGRSHGWGLRPVTLYLAQSATDSRDKMIEEWVPILEDSPYLENIEQVIRSNGRESIRWKPPGGRTATAPPTRKGGHGKTGVDHVTLDEIFAHADGQAEQGVRPTMITRTSPQIELMSTAGTAASEYLWGKVDDGRERCDTGEFGRVAYFEWSAYLGECNTPARDGEVYDLADASLRRLYMPALGYTITEDAIAAEFDSMPADEYARAYGNIWTQSVARIIPATAWASCLAPDSQMTGRLFLAVDAGPGQASGRVASVGIGGWNQYGRSHGEIVDSAPGLSWVAQRVGVLTRKWPAIEEVYVNGAGPIAAIIPDIKEAAACSVTVVGGDEYAAACQRFHEDVLGGSFSHIGQDVLDAAVAGAAKRTLLDSWAWARRTSTSEISPLVVATLLHWAVVTHPNAPLRIY